MVINLISGDKQPNLKWKMAAVAQWLSDNPKVGGSIPTLASQRLVLTAGGVAVHLLAIAEVPLSKALHPHAPSAL